MGLQTNGVFLAAGSLIEAAPQGIWGITGDGIIERNACKKHILGFTVVTPVLEADIGKTIAHNVVVRVIGSEKDGRVVRVAGIFHIEFRKGGIVHIVYHLLCDEGNENEILHIALNGKVDFTRNEARSINNQFVLAVLQIFNEEFSLSVSNGIGNEFALGVNLHFGIRHRNSSGSVYHCSLYSSPILGLRKSKNAEKKRGTDACQSFFHYMLYYLFSYDNIGWIVVGIPAYKCTV